MVALVALVVPSEGITQRLFSAMNSRHTILSMAFLSMGAAAHATPLVYLDRVIEREGISMRLSVEAIETGAPLRPQVGQSVRLKLDGKRLSDGQPLSNWKMGAWLDRATDPMSGALPVCGQRIAQYLGGNLMQRPLLDLTGYYVLSLDAEPSVSVLDPSVSFGGRSSLYSAMKLDGIGFDWLKTTDDALLFIALPHEKKLAIGDLQTLKILDHIALPGRPTRLALQPDERLLWAGQAGSGEEKSGVDVIDTLSRKTLSHISLPSGHHEFAFSQDSLNAYISTRQTGILTLVDINTLAVTREIKLGFQPLGLISVAGKDGNSLLWIINARAGRLHRFHPQGNTMDIIALEAGLGPAKVTPDGRHVLIVNPGQHRLYVLDAVTGMEKHRLTVSGQPYDIMFSAKYAYIRTLQSEQVGLLSLASLDSEKAFLKFIPAGAVGMAKSADLPRASSMTASIDNASAFFATPAERTVYHYMEGMNSPSSSVRTYGHIPMATLITQRGLREVAAGQYSTVIRLPSAGNMVLALASESPAMRECVGLKIDAPKKTASVAAITLRWLSDPVQHVSAGARLSFRLGLKNTEDLSSARSSVMRLRIVPTGGGSSVFWPLEMDRKKPGEWIATGKLLQDGGYYVHAEGSLPVRSVYSSVLVTGNSNTNLEARP
jgi:DNA-binding beta-propeller fold protein YncE